MSKAYKKAPTKSVVKWLRACAREFKSPMRIGMTISKTASHIPCVRRRIA